MEVKAQSILDGLQRVANERARRAADEALARRVLAVKAFQSARFAHTYADLLAQPRYAPAARFFLDDLYSSADFSARDDQFARVVPALVRLFPHEIVVTVSELSELHALSERFDTAMAHALTGAAIDTGAYRTAWQLVGQQADRERQVTLMLAVGTTLERFTRHTVLRHTLRLMRGPAQAAGLTALQRFLETGFDAFRAMRGATEFLATVTRRERAIMAALFTGAELPFWLEPTAHLGQAP
jgi:hypothetical protein